MEPRLSHADPATGEARAKPAELAEYIAAMAEELIVLARSAGFDTLASVLAIARREAQLRASRPE